MPDDIFEDLRDWRRRNPQLGKQPEPARTHRNTWKPTESTPKHYLKTNGTLRILTKLIKAFSMKTSPTPNITRQPTEPAKTNGTHRNHIRTHGNLTNPPELIESNSIHTKQILENRQNLPIQLSYCWGPGLWIGNGGLTFNWFSDNLLDRQHFWLNIIIITYQHHFWRRISLSETNNSCSTTNIISSSYLTTFLKNIINYGEEPITWANNRALDRHRRSELYSIPW